MRHFLTLAMLVVVAILGGSSIFQFALPDGWIWTPDSGAFKIAVGVGLGAATLIGGVFFWLDRRRND